MLEGRINLMYNDIFGFRFVGHEEFCVLLFFIDFAILHMYSKKS